MKHSRDARLGTYPVERKVDAHDSKAESQRHSLKSQVSQSARISVQSWDFADGAFSNPRRATSLVVISFTNPTRLMTEMNSPVLFTRAT
jgi:hypothetical protein